MLKWEEKYLHPLIRSLKMDGPPAVVLLRGISGSGKSTLSNRLITLLGSDKVSHCSADHYFIDENGDYHFDASNLPKAHAACIACLENALLTPSIRVIIVDNTHTRLWHMSTAEELAVKYGARIFVVEIVVPDQAHFSLCYQRQKHYVEKAVLYDQWIGWEKYLKPCIRVPMFVSREEMGLL
jgi:predicted kinase